MTVDAFILCYNEAKMIRHTLSFYGRFCKHITLIDNQSNDESLEVVRQEYPEVKIRELDTQNENREDLKIRTKNNCWKESKADYVIVVDMDEFLYDHNLEAKLEACHYKGIAVPAVVGYQMMSEDFPDDYTLSITQQVTRGYRDPAFDKNVIFSPKLVREINFGPGAHHCDPEFSDYQRVDDLVELKLLHYKYLNKEYLYKKHKLYLSRLSAFNRENGFSTHYQRGNRYIDQVYERKMKYLYQVIPQE